MCYRNDQVRYIYEQIHEVPIRNRAERGIGASILSAITGLASEDDLNIVLRIERGISHAAEIWRAGATSFVAAIQIEKN